MDAEIDALLADLRGGGAAGTSAILLGNEHPLLFAHLGDNHDNQESTLTASASSLAPAPASTPLPFLFPPLPTHRADLTFIRREAEQRLMRPLYVMLSGEHAYNGDVSPSASSSTSCSSMATALRVPHETIRTSGGSRLLAQVPTASPSAHLMPTRESLVMNPLQLACEYRDVELADSDGSAGVGGTGGSAMIDGFSKAMKENGEYLPRRAKARQPLAPGGATITHHNDDDDTSAPVASPEVTRVVLDSAKDCALNALVLTEKHDENDDAMLARLVLAAPGLDGCLTLQDLMTITSLPSNASQSEPESKPLKPSMAIQAAVVNPDDLLQSYWAVASDPIALRDLQTTVAEEKAVLAMRKTTEQDGGGIVALDELLQDLEGDEELHALGFGADDDEEETKKEVTKLECRKEMQSVGKTEKRMCTAELLTSSTLVTDAEIEELLLAVDEEDDIRDHSGITTAQPTPSSLSSSEWATMEPVDIHDFHTLVPDMAMHFNFELDLFQKQCIIHMERHECVFVAAHTSAGKTVVAEYAIALSQRHKTRVIYTSPIKALSNQKYRDFRLKFGAANVGLLTGDVAINPDANCLVMTTEILRSMLYRGADLLRDLEWVVFDEIHYINNNERGVVWEEVIIMLPPHVGMVFLSATTSNHLEFSDWIDRTKRHKIHVVSTPTRPVPLEHSLIVGGILFKLLDTNSDTGYDGFAFRDAKRRCYSPDATACNWKTFMMTLAAESLLPVVVFSFSKQQCESGANQIRNGQFCTSAEQSAIHVFVKDSIQRLQGSDRELPQVLKLSEMLQLGIGIHHSGLLPILKEMVEILFGRGLVKVLFATETFAMGVNMPARTVVFNGLRKHDGREYRALTPGEYTQMAGRAGRRGLDTVGTVIIVPQTNMFPKQTLLRSLLVGESTVLASQFRLTYNMILNLLRVEVLSVEDMIKRSFSEFRTQKELVTRQIPQRVRRSRKLLATLEQALKEEHPHLLQTHGSLEYVEEFHDLTRQKRNLERELLTNLITRHPHAARAAIAPGRVVLVSVQGLPDSHFALVLRTTETRSGDSVSARLTWLSPTVRVNGGGGDGDAHCDRDHGGRRSAGTGYLFKTITVLCLCPDAYELPVSRAPTGSASGKSQQPIFAHDHRDPFQGTARLIKSKTKRGDPEDDNLMKMMVGRGKASRRETKPSGGEIASNTKSSLMGKSYAILDIPEACLDLVSNIQISVNVRKLVATSSPHLLALAVESLVKLDHNSTASNKADVACVDVVKELQVRDLALMTTYHAWQKLYTTVLAHPCVADASLSHSRMLDNITKIVKLQRFVTQLTRALSSDSLSLFPDFQQRLSVLTKLGYISEDGVVQIKGRVACEIQTCDEISEDGVVQIKGRVACEIKTCDEIVLTELIFENVLANLEPEEIVAVLSTLVLQQKSKRQPTLTPRLTHARSRVVRIVESLHVLQLEQHLEMDPLTGYSTSALKFGLMEVVYEWARGMPFKELCGLTDLQEGVIVRCIMRLDEVCRDVRNAARVVGDPTLYRKMEVASEAIKRDVVFASSLYLS